MEKLSRSDGRHLVLVHFDGVGRGREEWIYNRADIDSAKVVWAWSDDLGCSESLTRYYPDRHVWLLEADDRMAVLKPYSPDNPKKTATAK